MDILEQAAIPLHVIAADLLTGVEFRLSTGDTVGAVRTHASQRPARLRAWYAPTADEPTRLSVGGS